MRHLYILRYASVAAAVVVFVTVLNGCQKDVSGSYLANDAHSVVWLQLVRTPDNRLSGQLSISEVDSSGKLTQNAVPITGAINSSNLTISISKSLGLEAASLAGTINDDKLTLTGAASAPLILRRARLTDYQNQLQVLNEESGKIIAAKQNADLYRRTLVELESVLARVERFDAYANLHLSRFPAVERRYGEITAKMSGYVAQERSLTGKRDSEVERSQLAIRVHEAYFETDQMHNDGVSIRESFDRDIKSFMIEVTKTEGACHIDEEPATWSQVQIDSRRAACKRLLAADTQLRQSFTALEEGLVHVEATYKRENAAQQVLIQSAEKLE